MRDIYIIRDLFFDNQASLGTLYIYDGKKQLIKCDCIERGWVDNKNRISCIPEGTYPIVWEFSDKFKRFLWEIKDVPGRSECKIHVANFWYQLNGCISPGLSRSYIDKDAVMDVADSTKALARVHLAMNGYMAAFIHIYNILNLK